MHPQVEHSETKMPSLQRRLPLLALRHQPLLSNLPQGALAASHNNNNHQKSSRRSYSDSRRRRSRDSGRLPWRRSFGRPGSVAADVIHQRRLQWRARIYETRLQAVYLAPRYRLHVSVPINDAVKEGILRRIEPWIRRELQALLGDGDPAILVHVVTSLYIAGLENKDRVSAEELNVQENFLEPLHPFLHDRTDMFWHELRCFAESPFNMETYDAVAEYKRLS